MEPTRSTKGGLEARFIVERTDGQPIDPSRRYLVLDIGGSDPYAVAAAITYSHSLRPVNSQMADDLLRALEDPTLAPPQHRYANPKG